MAETEIKSPEDTIAELEAELLETKAELATAAKWIAHWKPILAALPTWVKHFLTNGAGHTHDPAYLSEVLSDAARSKFKAEWALPVGSLVLSAKKDWTCAGCGVTIPKGATYISVCNSKEDYHDHGKDVTVKGFHPGCAPKTLTMDSVVGEGLGPCGIGVIHLKFYGAGKGSL